MGSPTRSLESWKHLFTDRGFTLLEDTIKNRRQKLKFVCDKGHKSSVIGQAFLKGSGCKQCVIEASVERTRFKQDYVSNFFKSKGCELLSIYKNNHTPLEYICICGNKAITRFHNFQNGKRCKVCKSNKFKGSNNHAWRQNQEEKIKEEKFNKQVRQVLYSCFKRKDCNAETDREKLGYNKTELLWRLTSHNNWIQIKLNKEKFTIDHIFPIVAFYRLGITDYKIINALDNLQPLSRSDNVKKLNKYNYSEFVAWLKSKGIMKEDNL